MFTLLNILKKNNNLNPTGTIFIITFRLKNKVIVVNLTPVLNSSYK